MQEARPGRSSERRWKILRQNWRDWVGLTLSGPGKPVEWYAHTPYNDDDPVHRGRAMNGFAHVTLTKDGGLTERFLNQDGSDMCG